MQFCHQAAAMQFAVHVDGGVCTAAVVAAVVVALHCTGQDSNDSDRHLVQLIAQLLAGVADAAHIAGAVV